MFMRVALQARPYLRGFCSFGQKFPVVTMFLFQIMAGLALIAAVGLIALLGGSVIWVIYNLLGVL